MNVMVQDLSPETFAPFGRVHDLGGRDGDPGATLVQTDGPGWSDRYTATPLISTNGSLGLTRAGAAPFEVVRMERHPNTEEALFCLDGDMILVTAPAGPAERPAASDLRAFRVPVGQAVVLHPGTWHDACRGVDGPVAYYWVATVGTGTDWRDLDPHPVTVSLDRA